LAEKRKTRENNLKLIKQEFTGVSFNRKSTYLWRDHFGANYSFVRLSVKLPQPGDSEGTIAVFESSCHLLLPI